MAEVLIKWSDATHLDPQKNAMCYKRGDPVVVVEDGHPWGAKELLPPRDGGKFCRVRITGITAAELQEQLKLLRPGIEGLLDQETIGVDERGLPRAVRRKRFGVLLDLLPGGVLSSLSRTGLYENTWENAAPLILDKVTGGGL